jgi:hypothetical protein
MPARSGRGGSHRSYPHARIGIRRSGPADASPTSKMNSRSLILCPSEVLTSIVSAPTSFKEGLSGLRRGSSVSFESFSDLGPRAELGPLLPQHRTCGAGTGESEKCHERKAAAPFTGAEFIIILTCKGPATKLPRRAFLQLAASAAALPAVSRIATAQTYPTRERRTKVAV